MNKSFKEWLLLNEIGHICLPTQVDLSLPDRSGKPQSIPVYMCDPKFETYHPVGYLDGDEYTWKDMIGLKGIGWEGLIPFENKFFSCMPREIHATIGSSRHLIRVPDNWYEYAVFIDENGQRTYDVPDGIYHPVEAPETKVAM